MTEEALARLEEPLLQARRNGAESRRVPSALRQIMPILRKPQLVANFGELFRLERAPDHLVGTQKPLRRHPSQLHDSPKLACALGGESIRNGCERVVPTEVRVSCSYVSAAVIRRQPTTFTRSLPDSFTSANSTESSRHAYTSKQQPRLPGTTVILRREAVLRGPPYAIADSCGTPEPRPFRLASEREQSPELPVGFGCWHRGHCILRPPSERSRERSDRCGELSFRGLGGQGWSGSQLGSLVRQGDQSGPGAICRSPTRSGNSSRISRGSETARGSRG